MKATHVQYIFAATTVLAAGFAVYEWMGYNKAVKAIQTATTLATLQAAYPVTA